MKILVLGLGYVGTANAILLSQYNDVTCFDIDSNRVDQINSNISPIEDLEASRYLSEKELSLKAVSKFPNLIDFNFIIIATPTNYNPETNYFDTSSIESCIEEVEKQKFKTPIIIRSTLPVGYTLDIQKKYPSQEIIFAPEFLREGKALHDSLHPSRIVIGSSLTMLKVLQIYFYKEHLIKMLKFYTSILQKQRHLSFLQMLF
jgi:UDPglucose 6-dehydrogenase